MNSHHSKPEDICPLTETAPDTSYFLRCHTLISPGISPCRSYDLIVSNVYGSVRISDLTIKEDKALDLLNRLYEESALPENLPWLAEDLLAAPEFVFLNAL